LAGVRPHDFTIGDDPDDQAIAVSGTVTAVEAVGPERLVHFDANGHKLMPLHRRMDKPL